MLCNFGNRQLTRICGAGKLMKFVYDKDAVFRRLEYIREKFHPTQRWGKIGPWKNTAYSYDGLQLIYRNSRREICVIPDKGKYSVRHLNTEEE
ncbi:hypothetical protein SNEBB_003369 [Seison nebaliae]|nr:hypothetical protein SNEBB_003369 [Seison nebaliae]